MLPRVTPIVETADWAASKTKSINVRLTGYVTQIDVAVDLSVTAATSTATTTTDDPYKAMSALKFTASNAHDWISFTDGRQAYWLSYIKSQGNATVGSLPSAGSSGTVTLQFSVHPGNYFGKTDDLTRVIPLAGKTNVQFQVTWGAASAIGTGYTITDASLSIVVHRMILKEGESEADAFAPAKYMLVPRYIPVTYSIDGTYSNYTFIKNIPTGAYIRDVFLMVVDSSDVRSNSDVTKIQVSDNKGNTPVKWDSWTKLVNFIRSRFYLPSAPAGIGLLQFRDIEGKDYGLDMTAASEGDWKLEMSTGASGGKIYCIYEGADMVNINPTVVG